MRIARPSRPSRDLGRHERAYRALLVAYPRSFRDEYGDDMVQAFRDLLLFSRERGEGAARSWMRTLRDLVTTAPRQRGSNLSRKPPLVLAIALLAIALLAIALQSRAVPVVLFGFALLVALPLVGIHLLHRAWLVRRTTGDPVGSRVVAGLACFVPGIAFAAVLGPDRSWFLLMAAGLLLISGALTGLAWAVTALATHGPADRRSRPALIAGLAGVVVLGAIGAASLNSYRYNQGPPGDHSVQHASAESRALWDAALDGDVAEVERLAATCADPWIQFPYGNGKHRAKGIADQRLLELASDEEAPYVEVMAVLKDAEKSWYERCGAEGAS
jgi:hypothetical protein